MIKVSVISINYGDEDVTIELIKSLKKSVFKNYEIIIIDNKSPRGNPLKIKEQYPDIKLILSEKNLGFAGANNLGIKEAQGDYLFFLNNDTEVVPDTISILLEAIENANAAGVSPQIRFYYNPNRIQYAGYSLMKYPIVKNYSIGYKEELNDKYNLNTYTPYLHGAAMLVKKNIIKKVGLLSERYFLYYEELDWCEHIRKSGYKLMYIGNAVVYHKESLSTGKGSSLKAYYQSRNRILFTLRNAPSKYRLISIIYLLLFSLPKSITHYFINLNINNMKAVCKAWGWSVKCIITGKYK